MSENPFRRVVASSANVQPLFLDMDDDGDLDLLASSGMGVNGGKLLYYENYAMQNFCHFQVICSTRARVRVRVRFRTSATFR